MTNHKIYNSNAPSNIGEWLWLPGKAPTAGYVRQHHYTKVHRNLLAVYPFTPFQLSLFFDSSLVAVLL